MIITGRNCLLTRFGTGGEPCQVDEGVASGFILVPKGWSMLKTETFNKAYVDEQIQLGVFIPFTNAFNSAPTTPDATTQESQLGQISVSRQGLPMYVFTYQKGYAFQRSAFSYNSNGEYDFIITYSNEVIKLAESKDGLSVKGFSGGMLNTAGYKEADGSVSAQTITSFQLTSPVEYNMYGVFISDLDFFPSTIDGVIDSKFTATADISDAKIYLDAVWASNESYSTNGLQTTSLAIVIDGVPEPPTVVTQDPVTKRYSLTPTTTPMTVDMDIYVKTKSTSPVSDVAKVGNKFYKGQSPVFQPTA